MANIFEKIHRNYPLQVDDNVVRSVASITFFLSVVMLLEPQTRFLILPMTIDFVIRWINPKYSPTVILTKWINVEVMANTAKPVFSPPKRFAILIGGVITSLLSISYIIRLEIMFLVLLIFLLIASGLQSWFDYCLGCLVYDKLIKVGITGRNKTMEDFQRYLSGLNSKNLEHTVEIQHLLTEKALSDGRISEEESVLIDQIVSDLHRYDTILSDALKDGTITYEEKCTLWHDRDQIARKAYEIANRNGMISNDEVALLSLLYDLLQQKALIISAN